MADFILSPKENAEFNIFKTAIKEVTGKELGLADFEFIFYPTQIGTAVEVVYRYEDENGGKAIFKRDITDHGSW